MGSRAVESFLLLAALSSLACGPTAAAWTPGRSLHQSALPPTPAYFFPLTGNDLPLMSTSSTAGLAQTLQAIPSPGVQWLPDTSFGMALECNRQREDSLVIPGLAYGSSGPFAVSLWIKAQLGDGQGLEYAFSHASATAQNLSTSPNVVHIYAPQNNHANAGTLRAILRDGEDTADETLNAGGPPTYLDSEGCVSGSCEAAVTPAVAMAPPVNGDWHMVTITTHPEGGKGFQMYHDAQLIGDMTVSGVFVDFAGNRHTATGGASISLNGNFTLCARADLDPERFFSGRLANLRIFDSALSGEEVKALYDADAENAVPAAGPWNTATTNAINDVSSAVEDPAATAETSSTPFSAVQVPQPMAFFPLSSPTLESLPLGKYKSVMPSGASIAEDPVFGGALRCRAKDRDDVALDSVPYGASTGAFSVNLWVRPGDDFDAEAPLYVFSHSGNTSVANATNLPSGTAVSPDIAAAAVGWEPNQVQIYFPQADNPGYGVARAYVRDSDDFYRGASSQGFIDSDGSVGDASWEPRAGPFPLMDGRWHMLTLTSQPDGGPGYRLYTDGALAGEISPGVLSDLDGTPLHADGSDQLILTSNIVLCSRADDATSVRHFDGDLAQLKLWDVALRPEEVAAVYAEFGAKAAAVGAEQRAEGPGSEFPVSSAPPRPQITPQGQDQQPADAAGDYGYSTEQQETENGLDYSSPLFAADGRACMLPLSYRGVQVGTCVGISGNRFCWAGDLLQRGEWAPCAEEALMGESETGANALVGGASGASLSLSPPLPSSVTILQVPKVARLTVHGEACSLPSVDEQTGEVMEDCVEVVGVASCRSASSGEWAECETADEKERAAPAAGGSLFVAERATVDAGPCILPAVSRGHLWFDCVPVDASASIASSETGEEAQQQTCPSSKGSWEICAPTSAPGSESSFTTKAFSPAETLSARSAPGGSGHLCALNPQFTPQGCKDGLTCVPLSSLTWNSSFELLAGTNSDNASHPLKGAGFCSLSPSGPEVVAFAALDSVGAPQPLSFFPLTGGRLESLTLPRYSGALYGSAAGEGAPLLWVDDALFGSVPSCSAATKSALHLNGAPYTSQSSSAVNLWVRRTAFGTHPAALSTATELESIFSHTVASTTSPAITYASIHLLDSEISSTENQSYSAVRAAVQDATGAWSLSSSPPQGSNTTEPTVAVPPVDVNDGAWRMLTLTSFPEGYALFVDGALIGSLQTIPDAAVAQEDASNPAGAAGAAVAQALDSILLCAPPPFSSNSSNGSAAAAASFFDGSVAHLMLFDAPLPAYAVSALYSAYKSGSVEGGGLVGGVEAVAKSAADSASSSSAFWIGVLVIGVLGSVLAATTIAALAYGSVKSRANRFERFYDSEQGGGGAPLGQQLPPTAPMGSVQLSSTGIPDVCGTPSSARSSVSSAGLSAVTAGSVGEPPRATAGSTMTDGVEIQPGGRWPLAKPTRIVVSGLMQM